MSKAQRRKTHSSLCANFQSQHPHLKYGLGSWQGLYNNIWQEVPELAVRKALHNSMLTTDPELTNADVNSVMALLKAQVFIPDAQWNANANLIAFNDGVLTIDTREFGPHKPEHYITSKLSFNYDPKLNSPTWYQFLQSVVPDASDFLQEFAGYCLTTLTKYETAVWLYGPPGGGKSTFVEGMLAMLGHRACVLGLSDIESSQFGLTNLPGKTLAISTEQPAHFVKSPHVLNAIISGEPINVNRKYHDLATIVPHAKLLWAMNELPRVDERGSGLFRRVKIVHFPEIPIEQRNPQIKEAIKAAGMSIANWALQGLERLTQRGKFLIPTSVQEATETYQLTNDVVQMFLYEACEFDNVYRTVASRLYNGYVYWCQQNGHKPTSSTRFGLDMNRLGYEKTKIGNVYWLGVRLTSQYDRESELNQYEN